MSDQPFDLIVLGAGPGGYVAAIRAAQLGFKVVCVEKGPTLGGTCLNVGCIPSKALLESSELFAETRHFATHGIVTGEVKLDLPAMMSRKERVVKTLTLGIESLFKKNKIAREKGHGRILAPGKVEVTAADGTTRLLEASRILIATGSTVAIPKVFPVDGDRIFTSTEALSLKAVPEHLVILGAGVIGLELGSVWARLGAKVTVLELLPRILPGFDEEVATAAQKLLAKQGLKFVLGAKVTAAQVVGEGVQVTYDSAKGEAQTLDCDRMLIAVGRRPYTEGLGLAELGLTLDPQGRVPVDAHYETAVKGIFAIGDVIAGPMLAHKAEDEGVAVAEIMAGKAGHVNYDTIPGVVYTDPEIATVGLTEEALKAAGREYRKGVFPFMANGRAKGLAKTDGFVKLLADAKTDRLLGAHILGARAGELIAELVVAMELGASAEDVARTCHAHPTLAEAIKEAALGVDARAIHA